MEQENPNETDAERLERVHKEWDEKFRKEEEEENRFRQHEKEITEEFGPAKTIFLLTLEMANGEYSEFEHFSAHGTVESAKGLQAKLLNPEHLKGEDAINKWEECRFEPGAFEFRTGNWGFVAWKIKPIPLFNIGGIK